MGKSLMLVLYGSCPLTVSSIFFHKHLIELHCVKYEGKFL
jgi:hypothetical protein